MFVSLLACPKSRTRSIFRTLILEQVPPADGIGGASGPSYGFLRSGACRRRSSAMVMFERRKSANRFLWKADFDHQSFSGTTPRKTYPTDTHTSMKSLKVQSTRKRSASLCILEAVSK